jgi:hypothetical protein
VQPRYLEYQSHATVPGGELVTDPAAGVHPLTDEALAAAGRVGQVLDPTALESAFGAPGQAGDEVAIRAAAAALCAIYVELIDWGIKVRSLNVGPTWAPVYAALSEYVTQPLHQFQDFSATFSASIQRMVTDFRADKIPSIELTFELKLTIDDTTTDAFKAALATASSAK